MKTGLRFSFLYIDNRKRVAVCFAKMKVESLSLVVFCLQSAMSQGEISEVERSFTHMHAAWAVQPKRYLAF